MSPDNEKWLAANPAPGFSRYPDHKVNCETVHGEVVVDYKDTAIARSSLAILVRETGHNNVYYLPPNDVKLAMLSNSSHVTRCPFKGKARYWNVHIGDHEIDNAVWSYEAPYDEVLELAGMMAFSPGKVTITAPTS